jgi:hypothetical protein
MYIAPPATSFKNRNPSFRVYTAETSDWKVADYAQYRLDLAAANQLPPTAPLQWSLAYNFKQEYFLWDTTPSHIYDWIEELKVEELKIVKYLQNSATAGPGSKRSCDAGCRAMETCDMQNPYNGAALDCKDMPQSPEQYIFHLIYGQWLNSSS